MAKKRRHRVWWMAVHEEAYNKLRKTEIIPDGSILFDKQNHAFSHGYANRFEIIRNEDNSVVTKDDYAQLNNKGRIHLVGVTGDIIDWKDRQLVIEKLEDGNVEAIYIHKDLAMPIRFVDQVLQESDENYLKHLQSPIARAGGIVPPEQLVQLVTARETLAHGLKANQVEEGEEDGTDEGSTTDTATA